MKAKEMFEELGYEIESDGNISLIYIKYEEDKDKETGCIHKIIFDKAFTRVAHTTNSCFDFIDYKELQAINKQIEELGWLKDE